MRVPTADRRRGVAAVLTGLALALAAVPAHAAEPTSAPAATATGQPEVVTPYGTNELGVPLFRVAPGQHLPALTDHSVAYQAIVTVGMLTGDRTFRVFVPRGLVGPAATVVAMAGYAQRAEPETYMRWGPVATQRHFVVLYPRGYALSFNAGRCCGQAVLHRVDDSAFLLRMLEVERDLYPQNERRLYLTGFSNGGMMAYRFACEHPDKVAAIGVVAAAYVARGFCLPSAPVPVMHVHGMADASLPWLGLAYNPVLHTSIPSVAQTDAVFGRVDAAANVPVNNVHLPGIGHVWPHLGGAGHYDATGQIAAFLLRFHR